MNSSSTCKFCKAPWSGQGNRCGCGGSEWDTQEVPFVATDATVCRFCGSHWSLSTDRLMYFKLKPVVCKGCGGHEWVNPERLSDADRARAAAIAEDRDRTAKKREAEKAKQAADEAERALHEGDIDFLDVVSFYSWLLILGIPVVALFWGWTGTFCLLGFAVLAGFVMAAMNHQTLGKTAGAVRCIPACGGMLLLAAPFVYLLFTMKC